ncbi:MAG: LysR family transcriptional regulator [Acidimicrobiales bacterium]
MDPLLPDLSIRQLEYLVAVDESDNWARAAASLGVSASALSQGLAELERRLGVPLFERSGRRRLLRASAKPVLDHARQVVALTADLTRWANRARGAAVGNIRVGLIDAAAIHHFGAELRAFREARPDLDMHLRVAPSETLLSLLAAADLDIVVCVEPTTTTQAFDLRPLLTEELAVYRPDGRRAGPPPSWGPWVLFPSGSHTRELITTELRALGSPVDVVAESHQPEVLKEMVRLGLGWTVLPVVQAETGEAPLTRAKILARRQLVAATRSGSAPDPGVGALLDALVDD